MATGASNSDLAIILIDARKGVLPQTKRHATICSLLGIKSIVLAVNKIDLVGYDKTVFDRIVGDFTAFSRAARLHGDRADPGLGPLRRQHRREERQHGLVLRADPDGAPGNGGRRVHQGGPGLPLPRPVGEPAEPRLSRLQRHRRLRPRARRRADRRRGLRPLLDRHPDRVLRRRPQGGQGRRRRHPDARRRGRRDARRRARAALRAAGRRRPVLRPRDLDDRRAALARPPVPDADRHALRPGLRDHHQAQARRGAPGAPRGEPHRV